MLVDAEHAFDPVYSQKVGVDRQFSLSAFRRSATPVLSLSPSLLSDSTRTFWALSPPYLMKIHRLFGMHAS